MKKSLAFIGAFIVLTSAHLTLADENSETQSNEKTVTGEAYFADGRAEFPGDSRASKRLWSAVCDIAKERAVAKAEYKCAAQKHTVRASQFANNGECSSMYFSPGFTATLNYVCESEE